MSREHGLGLGLGLALCLEKEEVTPFPFKTVKRNRESRRAGKINIYCKCRTQEGGNMIACSGWDECSTKNVLQPPDRFGRKRNRTGTVTIVRSKTKSS